MKHSLIQLPEGSRFARIDFWVLEVLGKKEHAAAACLAQLEYWQRLSQDLMKKGKSDGWVRKSAADFSATLRGLFGEDKIRAGLRLLVKQGWVEEDEETELVGQLWCTRKKYRLIVVKVNEAVAQFYAEKSKETDLSSSGEPENRAAGAGKSGRRGRKIGSNTICSTLITTTTTAPTACGSGSENHVEDLVVADIAEPHSTALKSITSSLPHETKQQIADELAAVLLGVKAGTRPPIRSIRAWLKSLADAAKIGCFVPDAGVQAAAAMAVNLVKCGKYTSKSGSIILVEREMVFIKTKDGKEFSKPRQIFSREVEMGDVQLVA